MIFSDVLDSFPAPDIDYDDVVGGRGLRDCFCVDVGDALDLCTESLGSESCDGRLDPVEEEALLERTAGAAEKEQADREDESGLERRSRSREPKKTTDFPPPLRWMSEADGRRTGFIRADRRDGRLVLTAVRIERPEIFRATREGGRLRLQAVDSDGDEEGPPEDEEEVEENGEWGDQWQRGRGGEGLRRCQDTVNSSRIEVPAWWNHRFVTMA